MANSEIILALRDVTVETVWPYDAPLHHVDLILAAGELAVVRIESFVAQSPLADVACGIVVPDGGAVAYRGIDWQDRSADSAALARAAIGRIFSRGGWISNLDVDENIMLSQRHHTRRRLGDIESEALHLASQFGLAALPRARPHLVRPDDLRRAACIRALMGKPKLLLLEAPTRGLAPEAAAALSGAIAWVRSAGAAALWIDDAAFVPASLNLNPTQLLEMRGGQLAPSAASGIANFPQ